MKSGNFCCSFSSFSTTRETAAHGLCELWLEFSQLSLAMCVPTLLKPKLPELPLTMRVSGRPACPFCPQRERWRQWVRLLADHGGEAGAEGPVLCLVVQGTGLAVHSSSPLIQPGHCAEDWGDG